MSGDTVGESEAKRNGDSHQLRRRGKKFWVMVGTLGLGLVGSVSGVLFEYLWAKPRFEQSLSGAVAPTLTSAQQSPGIGDTSRRCRTLVDARHAPVDIAPCIARAGDQLEISTRVMSREATEVTVHVWLHDSQTNSRREYTLKGCRLTFTVAGQFKDCGPYLVRPDRPGRYRTATGAQTGIADRPLVWQQSNGVGVLSAAVFWPE